ncbi:MAG: rRNA maturation RNase YbeY [Melioribacteraceae bacterium]|nr:rRNA maturation RNase YbeY [Melioribacteraceae bacterium]
MKNLTVNKNQKFSLDKREIQSLTAALIKKLNLKLVSLIINFVDPDYIRKINKQYLNHDYSTDILTFNYSENLHIIDAEIYVSLYDAFQNAEKWKVSPENEVARLIIHGILHLCGFDDQLEKDREIMREKEDELVTEFNSLIKRNIKIDDC